MGHVADQIGGAAVSLAEAQAYVRIETGEEEALLAGLLRSATAVCEGFIGQWLIERRFSETLGATGGWQRLSPRPVRSIDTVEALAADGSATVLPAENYALEIDASGVGEFALQANVDAGRIRVGGVAGIAAEPNGLPEPIRQGILRLTAHFFAHRDGDGDMTPPTAVTALWRPYRRVQL